MVQKVLLKLPAGTLPAEETRLVLGETRRGQGPHGVACGVLKHDACHDNHLGNAPLFLLSPLFLSLEEERGILDKRLQGPKKAVWRGNWSVRCVKEIAVSARLVDKDNRAWDPTKRRDNTRWNYITPGFVALQPSSFPS